MGVGVANQITAVADVRHEGAGAASGVVSAAYQVGGALGLAIITTLSTSRTADALAGGAAQADALVQGSSAACLSPPSSRRSTSSWHCRHRGCAPTQSSWAGPPQRPEE
jgi:hypothetical protein